MGIIISYLLVGFPTSSYWGGGSGEFQVRSPLKWMNLWLTNGDDNDVVSQLLPSTMMPRELQFDCIVLASEPNIKRIFQVVIFRPTPGRTPPYHCTHIAGASRNLFISLDVSSFLAPSESQSLLVLNCLVLGESSDHVFEVEIARTKSVGSLRPKEAVYSIVLTPTILFCESVRGHSFKPWKTSSKSRLLGRGIVWGEIVPPLENFR